MYSTSAPRYYLLICPEAYDLLGSRDLSIDCLLALSILSFFFLRMSRICRRWKNVTSDS